VWADLVLRAERNHADELLAWAALSLVMATASLVLTKGRRGRSPLLAAFGSQLAVWAVVIGAVGAIELQRLTMRDLSSATRLERITWARAGLDVGIVGIGLVLGGASHVLARSQRGWGAAAAIVASGLALFVIDLRLLAVISR
jgi:Family of unknown function (DUF6992)